MISDTDIRRAVSGNAFMAGLRLFGLDGVMSVTEDSKGETIEGRVHGSAHAVYRQQISLAQRPGGGLRVTATCTCPAHRDCKHIAAVLFAFRAKLAHDDAPPRPTLATPAPPPQPTAPADPIPQPHPSRPNPPSSPLPPPLSSGEQPKWRTRHPT